MHFIDRLQLYPTIFANHQDDVGVDTSSWSLAYNSLQKILHPPKDSGEITAVIERVRSLLIRDSPETYYAWIIAAFAPWSTVPGRLPKPAAKAKPLPPRTAEVARDSLRADNKTIVILKCASINASSIIDTKSSLLENRLGGTAAEIRQQIGLLIISWNKDWRLCVLLCILQEIMNGGEFSKGKDLGHTVVVMSRIRH